MGWIRRMDLKRALFSMMAVGIAVASVLSILVFWGCIELRDRVAPYGVEIIDAHTTPPTFRVLPEPSAEAIRMVNVLEVLQFAVPVVIFIVTIFITATAFYRMKLKVPLEILQSGAEHIMENDLDFSVAESGNQDELGRLCTAFEKMRKSLLANNKTLWRQAEERRRLNAVFSHDLRNPVTVLKGTVKLLKQGIEDAQALDRMEHYTKRMEQYIDAMSSIQKLEEIPIKKEVISCDILKSELEDTVQMLAPRLACLISVPDERFVTLDHGVFLNVAENLIRNAARFAERQIHITFKCQDDFFCQSMRKKASAEVFYCVLTVADDGCGFSSELIQFGPKPFGRSDENGEHLGVGLYSSQTLCQKHGGRLLLQNNAWGGATVTAFFAES